MTYKEILPLVKPFIVSYRKEIYWKTEFQYRSPFLSLFYLAHQTTHVKLIL